jgi:predicted N-acyltransferase
VTRPAEPALRVVEDLAEIPAAQWNALAGDHPFLRHELLHALHATGCASAETGWLPQYLALWRGAELAAAMPLYVKSHSYGEYVFDWAWADAYARHGISYYPKLLSAVPFSPVTGPRLLGRDADARARVLGAALALARETSSLHILFPLEDEAREMEAAGMMLRRGVQFHWQNPGYESFEAFLGTLSQPKRKKIRQERRKVADARLRFRRLTGTDIAPEHWRFFTRCYNLTYRAHYSTPYLNLAFFERLGAVMPENVLLVLAERDGKPFAAALDVYTDQALYGRYWGAIGYVPGLHFETCYYQAMEFCIERGIALFEGGAQGEHKLARGFLPVATRSAHWLRHPRFADAVEQFLAKEARGIEHYIDELNERAPFKSVNA